MSTLNRIRRSLSGLAVETRPEFKRVDASRAQYDDGSWLSPEPASQPRGYSNSRRIPETPSSPGPTWAPITGPISDTDSGSRP